MVYLDFLKKASTQGAEIFIKQATQRAEKASTISEEKEKIVKSLERKVEEMKEEMANQKAKHRQKEDKYEQSLLSEKDQSQMKIAKLKGEAEEMVNEY